MAIDCTQDQAGCTPVKCQDPSFPDPGQLFVSNNPTGSGGIALNCNFNALQYRQPKCNYNAGADPTKTDDVDSQYCIGSRWLNKASVGPNGTPSATMWICVNNASGNAVWVPWLRWQDNTKWASIHDNKQVLMVDTHLAVDGEFRRVYVADGSVGGDRRICQPPGDGSHLPGFETRRPAR